MTEIVWAFHANEKRYVAKKQYIVGHPPLQVGGSGRVKCGKKEFHKP
jgi:hypothetical protein